MNKRFAVIFLTHHPADGIRLSRFSKNNSHGFHRHVLLYGRTSIAGRSRQVYRRERLSYQERGPINGLYFF